MKVVNLRDKIIYAAKVYKKERFDIHPNKTRFAVMNVFTSIIVNDRKWNFRAEASETPKYHGYFWGFLRKRFFGFDFWVYWRIRSIWVPENKNKIGRKRSSFYNKTSNDWSKLAS